MSTPRKIKYRGSVYVKAESEPLNLFKQTQVISIVRKVVKALPQSGQYNPRNFFVQEAFNGRIQVFFESSSAAKKALVALRDAIKAKKIDMEISGPACKPLRPDDVGNCVLTLQPYV